MRRFRSLLPLWYAAVLCTVGLPPAAAARVDAPAGAPSERPKEPPSDTVRATEADYYKLVTLPIPEGIVLEVGGMTLLPDGSLVVATRRGEIWRVENPYMLGNARPFYRRFAQGLHEPLGLAYRDGALYATQRGELTRMRDLDGDGRADRFETVYAWPLSGNYHEYSYGPVFRENGNMLVTLNLAWVGRGASLAPWRGWTLEITPEGEMKPIATGMRSPAGFGLNAEGDLFYAENQGDWVGSGRITHVEEGDFVGNPAGLLWSHLPASPLRLKPEDVPDTGEPMYDVARSVPALKPPTVWFPHTILGISTSDILADTTGGGFGPFEGQLFVGDQGHSKIMRVFMEKVNGVYQGAVFPFREGFASGVLRMAWGRDGSLFVGQTSRGWDATGKAPYALQRVVWTGKMPFEAKAIRAMPDGFEIEFTTPVDRATAAAPGSYRVTGFTYKYHHNYGSPVVGQQELPVRGVVVSEDGRRARLAVDGLRQGYVHEVKMPGVRSASGAPLLHDTGYYTLNEIPRGAPLALRDAAPAGRGAGHGAHAASVPAQRTSTPAAEAERRAPAGPAAKRVTSLPASWTNGPDVTVTVGTLPGLRFDLPAFEVKAGSRVRLIFNNTDDMLHNLLVVAPGTADKVAQMAIDLGLEGPQRGYVPETDLVLYHTALLQPETGESIYFVAPTTPGTYTYVCTFPGHSMTMQGTMKVLP